MLSSPLDNISGFFLVVDMFIMPNQPKITTDSIDFWFDGGNNAKKPHIESCDCYAWSWNAFLRINRQNRSSVQKMSKHYWRSTYIIPQRSNYSILRELFAWIHPLLRVKYALFSCPLFLSKKVQTNAYVLRSILQTSKISLLDTYLKWLTIVFFQKLHLTKMAWCKRLYLIFFMQKNDTE